MGLVDRVLVAMNLGSDEDEYEDDDFLDEEDEVEEEIVDEVKPKRFFFKKKQQEEEEELPAVVKQEEVKEKPKAVSKVTPFRANNRKQVQQDMGVCVIKPTTVEDAREVTETLLKGRTVVLNMEGVNLDIAQRIIDFTSGSCYAIGGNLQKISSFIFIITPPNVEISGDFADILSAYDSGIHADL